MKIGNSLFITIAGLAITMSAHAHSLNEKSCENLAMKATAAVYEVMAAHADMAKIKNVGVKQISAVEYKDYSAYVKYSTSVHAARDLSKFEVTLEVMPNGGCQMSELKYISTN